MNYRSDIDGLRAISVLIVLLFHANIPYIETGFIGVDIFFVISGFLITSNILRSLEQGNFNIFSFYKNRFLRLAPALIALVLIVTLVAFIFFLPEDLVSYLRSLKHTLLYKSNLYFAQTTGGYFDNSNDYIPLLHTWSLAIEWQWYAMLPLFLWAAYKVIPQKALASCVFAVLLLAILYALYQSVYSQSVTQHYYALSVRIFELLMGASLSFFPYHRIKIPKAGASLIGMLAIITILYATLIPSVAARFPNYWAVLICMCASCLIILGKLEPQNYATRFLSFKPLVFIGLISYSLYLWHWPIFSLVRYLNFTETVGLKVLLMGLSIVCGYLSWKFIEQKTRYLRALGFIPVILFMFIVPALSAYSLERVAKQYEGFPGRFRDTLYRFEQTKKEYFAPGRKYCIDAPHLENDPFCIIGDQEHPQKRALILGDSFANHYWNFLDILARDAQMSIDSNTRAACMMLPDLYLFNWFNYVNRVYQECADLRDKRYEKIKKNHYDYVIIAQLWSYYLTDNFINKPGDSRSPEESFARFKQALDQAIVLIIEAGSIPVIMDQTYVDLNNETNKCYMQSVKRYRDIAHINECGQKIVFNQNELTMRTIFKELQAKYPELILIEPVTVQCPDGYCEAVVNGIPIYSWGGHINDYASRVFGEQYLKRFGNPFKRLE